MPTISELVAQHSKIPGDIRVWDTKDKEWMRPYWDLQVGSETDWIGPTSTKPYGDQWGNTARDYQLYTEPKPKVMRAQYLIVPFQSEKMPHTTSKWYLDANELRSDVEMRGRTFSALRLDEREFER